MAVSNRERVGKGLDLLAVRPAPLCRTRTEVATWRQLAIRLAGHHADAARVPSHSPPISTIRRFCSGCHVGPVERRLPRTLWATPNGASSANCGTFATSWAHNEQFSSNDAIRALDSMERLLNAVSAAEAADRSRPDAHGPACGPCSTSSAARRCARSPFQPTEGKPQGGLKPWREVVTPHPDVASGRYQQAEFAADLWQVYQGEGSDEYKHPTEFFRRTFLTEGLRRLLTQAMLRLSGKGGDPVVELQTNFGGGKTHSMLALYHLFSGTPASELPGAEELVKELGIADAEERPPGRFRRHADFTGQAAQEARRHRRSAPSGARSPGSLAARKATSSSRRTTRRPPTPATR